MFEASGRRNRSFDAHGKAAQVVPSMENLAQVTPALTAVRARLDQLLIGVARGLEFDLQRGNLVLRGKVTSFYHKQLAQEVVRAVAGSVDLINSVEVQEDQGM